MNASITAPLCLLLATLGCLAVGCSSDPVSTPAPGPNGAGAGALIGEVAQPCVPDCAGKTCGFDGCFDQCGICGEGEACEAAQCVVYACTPNCEGRVCGDNGCGGSCGDCADGEFCLPATGTCNVADPCQGVTFEGCCNGELLTWCATTTLETMDCGGGCGWDPEIGEYNCGTDGGDDPTGAFPKTCAFDCTPDCSEASCGSDGCGGSCGICTHGKLCVDGACAEDPCQGVTFEGCCDGEVAVWCEDGELSEYDCDQAGEPSCGWVPDLGYYCDSDGGIDPSGELPKACDLADCTPNCTDVACGDDGCGGSCGGCGDGQMCEAGICVADDCLGITYDGCCDGEVSTWCEDGELQTDDCTQYEGLCGWVDDVGYYCESEGSSDPSGALQKDCVFDDPTTCNPSCDGKTCGDDGCDGSCGTCDDGSTCTDGACVVNCVAATECDAAITCGDIDDGCGGTLTCGTCGDDETCNAGTCECAPITECEAAITCGDVDDGCGGTVSCGTCDDGDTCTDGACCTPTCDNATCDNDDGCGGTCGCADGDVCKAGTCECAPTCDNATCDNDDGCGGTCGCAATDVCNAGTCECVPTCGDVICSADGCGGVCGACTDGSTAVDIFDDVSDHVAVPAHITVAIGTTVVWTNLEDMIHTIVSSSSAGSSSIDPNGPLDSPNINKGGSWSFTFDTPGVFHYICGVPVFPHSSMKGSVTVQGAECTPANDCGTATCGDLDDGCGGTVSCGTCEADETCEAGQCT
jgi:plastocyanin